MTIREILAWAYQRLQYSDDPQTESRRIICQVLQVDWAYLYSYPEAEPPPAKQALIAALVARRAQGEPLPYVLGEWSFYGLDFTVTPEVLIPRPETELLVEEALRFAREHDTVVAADIGTGSGAIAISFGLHAPHAQVAAVEISANAVAVARQNVQRHVARNVTVYAGSLIDPLLKHGIRVNLMMANLPYIPTDTVPHLTVSLYEPYIALDGGMDGLRIIEGLLERAPRVCTDDALLLFEIGADQGATVRQMAEYWLQPRSIEILPDYAQLDRILKIQR
jgi:release factor glutamine methyltransferase